MAITQEILDELLKDYIENLEIAMRVSMWVWGIPGELRNPDAETNSSDKARADQQAWDLRAGSKLLMSSPHQQSDCGYYCYILFFCQGI